MKDDIRAEILRTFRFVNGHSDVWRLFYNGQLFPRIITRLALPFVQERISKVAGIEARGFILGAAVAQHLGVGFVAIRKPGSLYPGPKLEQTTSSDYRGKTTTLSLQRAAISPGDRILLVDDWFETGSQAQAAKSMLEELGATVVGYAIIVDQLRDEVRLALGRVESIVSASELPKSSNIE